MLDLIAEHADALLAATNVALTVNVLFMVRVHFRTKTCSVPLTSSVTMALGLAFLGLVFLSINLPVAVATVVAGSAVWAVVASQRVAYNKGNDTKARDPDAHVRPDDSRAFGAGPAFRGRSPHGRDCVHYARAGWCRHRDGTGRRGPGEEAGMGLEGAGGGAEAPEPSIPDYVHYTPPATTDVDGDSAELEEES